MSSNKSRFTEAEQTFSHRLDDVKLLSTELNVLMFLSRFHCVRLWCVLHVRVSTSNTAVSDARSAHSVNRSQNSFYNTDVPKLCPPQLLRLSSYRRVHNNAVLTYSLPPVTNYPHCLTWSWIHHHSTTTQSIYVVLPPLQVYRPLEQYDKCTTIFLSSETNWIITNHLLSWLSVHMSVRTCFIPCNGNCCW